MPAIPISCMVCGQNFPEKDYIAHMTEAHGTESTAEAMEIEKLKKINLPPGVPPGITEADLPDADFMETIQKIQEMETKVTEPVQTISNSGPQPTVTVSKPEPKHIELTYMYTGQDDKGHPVETLEIDVGLYHFAVAYCNSCKRQIESREVVDLKKGGTHEKPNVRNESKLPNVLRTPRVRKANKTRVQNESGGKSGELLQPPARPDGGAEMDGKN